MCAVKRSLKLRTFGACAASARVCECVFVVFWKSAGFCALLSRASLISHTHSSLSQQEERKKRLPLLHEDVRELLGQLDSSAKTWSAAVAETAWEWMLARRVTTALWVLSCGCLCRKLAPVRVTSLSAELTKWTEYTTKARRIAWVR